MNSSRRTFIKNATTTGAAILAAPAVFGSTPFREKRKATDAVTAFKLKYAPHFGTFSEHAGENPVDNIKFCYDKGFRAMFDNGLMSRPSFRSGKDCQRNAPAWYGAGTFCSVCRLLRYIFRSE